MKQFSKQFSDILGQLAMLGQLGISLLMPLLLCMLLCWFLTSRGCGMWVFIPGIIFGLGGSFMTGYKFYLSESKKSKKDEKNKKVSFNQHH